MKGTILQQVDSLARWTFNHAPEAVIAVAILIGAVLRLAGIGSVPPGLFVDEAVKGYDAYSLFLTGRDHHGHFLPVTGLESFGDWVPPLLTFIVVPFVGIFGLEVEVLRSVTGVIGVIAIPLVYFLGTALTGRRPVGVAAACLLAVSPQHVHLSRWAIPPAAVPTMVALTLLLVMWSVQRRSDRGIVVAALAASLSVATYSAMKLYIPLVGIAAIVIFSTRISWVKPRTLLIAGIIVAAIAGPALFATAFGEGGTRFQQVSAFQEPGFGIGGFIENYLSFFSPSFLFVSGDGDPSHTPPGFGVELRAAAPLLVAGLIMLVHRAMRPPAKSDRALYVFFLAALLLYPIPGSLTVDSPHTLRGAQLVPLSAVLAGLGLTAIIDLARRAVQGRGTALARAVPIGVAVAVAVVVALELRTRYMDYFVDYPAKVGSYFEYGMEDALRFVQAHESEYDDLLIADINQAYIYVLFYSKAPPALVQQTLQVRRNPPEFNHVDTFGKYRFVGLRERPPRNVPGEPLGVLHSVHYPDGRTAFEVIGWVARDGKRTLLVWKP
jgi:4-amino-4-deoxy-L-arabinose transferase-like glycosyltransferase